MPWNNESRGLVGDSTEFQQKKKKKKHNYDVDNTHIQSKSADEEHPTNELETLQTSHSQKKKTVHKFKFGSSNNSKISLDNVKPAVQGLSQWNQVTFDAPKCQEKFLRLIGGVKKSSIEVSSSLTGIGKSSCKAMKSEDEQTVNNALHLSEYHIEHTLLKCIPFGRSHTSNFSTSILQSSTLLCVFTGLPSL